MPVNNQLLKIYKRINNSKPNKKLIEEFEGIIALKRAPCNKCYGIFY